MRGKSGKVKECQEGQEKVRKDNERVRKSQVNKERSEKVRRSKERFAEVLKRGGGYRATLQYNEAIIPMKMF